MVIKAHAPLKLSDFNYFEWLEIQKCVSTKKIKQAQVIMENIKVRINELRRIEQSLGIIHGVPLSDLDPMIEFHDLMDKRKLDEREMEGSFVTGIRICIDVSLASRSGRGRRRLGASTRTNTVDGTPIRSRGVCDSAVNLSTSQTYPSSFSLSQLSESTISVADTFLDTQARGRGRRHSYNDTSRFVRRNLCILSLTRKDLSWDTVRLPILQILWGIVHSANLDFESLIWDEFEWQTVDRSSRPSKMSKLLYTCFTKLIINHFLSCNKSIPRRSNSELHNAQDDQPITKLSNIVKGDYKFGMEIPDTMISDAIKKSAGYNYYIAMKKENTYVEWGQKLKGPTVDDPAVRSLLDLQKGSKASILESLKQKKQAIVGEGSNNAHNKHYADSDSGSDAILYSSCLEESENETDDADDSDMDLSDDNPDRDDDVNLLNETPANELTDLVSNLVYTDAQTASAVIYPEGNPELTSYILGASEVPLAFEKAVQVRVHSHIPKAIANYVRPRLNTSMLDVMKNNQISLFTKPSTSTDDLSDMDLKLKLLHKIYESKSNTTHPTNQRLYDTLYESVYLDHDALNAQDADPSFHKRSHDNQDPPDNRKGENMLKIRKDVGEPSSRSSRRNKSPVVHAQDDTPAMKPLDQADEYVQNHPNPEWFPKKLGSANAMRKTTWFDLLLKLDIDQHENLFLDHQLWL
ncbi:hypothetical protein Tco_1514575 [Tanacetum coccineum]